MPGGSRWADKIASVAVTIIMSDGSAMTVAAEEPVIGWRVHTPTIKASFDGITITQLPMQDAIEFGMDIRPSPGHPLAINWDQKP